VASTRARKSITAKTRAEDDRLTELLRHADIAKLKKLMAPLIERHEPESNHLLGEVRKKHSG
jgi:hypothetical protein